MNSTPPNLPSSGFSPFLPVLLLSLALIFLLGWQFSNAARQRAGLQRIEQSRAETVKQALAVQADLERLCASLLDLAQTDPAARELVQRYGITRGAVPAAK